MKVLIVGSGGVGGYFGGRLAAAGNEVVFVARGRHLEALRRDGLRLLSQRGDLHLPEVQATDDPGSVGEVDIVLLCTKLWDLEDAARALRPVVGPGTGVIALQNGIDKEAIVRDILGPEPLMGGTAQIAATIEAPGIEAPGIEAPGTIRHTGTMAMLIYGELDGRDSARLQAFDAMAQAAEGFDALRADDIELEIWKKFSFLAPFAGMTCYARRPIGPVRDDPDRRAMLEDLAAETVAASRAAGARFGPERTDQVMKAVERLPAEMKSSMLHDLEAGRRLELDWLTGAVLRLGRAHGVATPVSRKVYDALAPAKDGG